MRRFRLLWLVAALAVSVSVVQSADIYVSIARGKNKAGDGSTANPYKELGYALGQAKPGDILHVAEGHYPGEAGSGHWKLAVPGLTILAGYSDDFAERDPFRHITLLAYDASPGNTTKRVSGPELDAREQANRSGLENLVLDGLTIDGGPRNSYLDEPGNPSLRTDLTPNDPLIFVILEKGFCIIRNCTLLNPGVSPCIIASSKPGGRFEIYNNVFVNSVQHHLDVTCKSDKDGNRADWEIHHNSFLFSWKTSSGGSGVYCRPYTNVNIHHNFFAFGDDAAVQNSFYETRRDARGVPTTGLPNEHVRMDYNHLWMWQRGLYGWVLKGQSGILYTRRVDELEDTSLASAEGNTPCNPGFTYNKEWMTRFVNRSDGASGEVTMDALNQFRELLGLPLVANEGKNRYGYCCRYPLADVMAFRVPTYEGVNEDPRGASMEVLMLRGG